MMHEQTHHPEVERVRVLLIEDCPTDARVVQFLLRQARGAMEVRHGLFEVTRADRLASALDRLARADFDVVLLDLQLPDSDGLETLTRVKTAAEDVPIIVMTGLDDDGIALSVIQSGAQDYLAKDHLDERVLARTIRHAIERKRAEVQLLRRAGELEAAHARIQQQAAELKARAEELDRINRELDDFTYIASHDLKEPLHGIAAYCGLLLEDYADGFDAEGQRRLKMLVKLCDRLETLIADLLTYCRVGGAHPAQMDIRLDEVVAEVLETLRPAIDRRNASVRVAGRLPTVTGDATLIGTALGNLIANGLKFNQDARPRVEIGSLPTSPATLYIRDNGIGIERKYHEEIFTIFRRLHSRREYEGSGAGLTIVRKIVQAHGGRIWLESEPGRGTTFFVTLGPEVEKPAVKSLARRPHWGRGSSAGSSKRKPRKSLAG
ncbi:MAG: response regulator [Pirellulales bacterium]|nr:response regulator [Pirellulales bacterium]